MEKQRSFSFNLKPTRLLVFSFTLSSSLLLLFFSIWVFKCIPLIPQETQLHFNKSSQTLGLKPINIQAFSISAETHFRIPDISSGNSVVSVVEKVQIKQNKSGVSDRDNKSEETQNGALDGITYSNHDQSSKKIQVSGGGRIEKKKTSECDVSKGRWVFDESYPLYTNSSCPFIDEGFSCEANGRPDKDYIRWRWQPHDCNIPRFNAVKMLELIRGKRLVFVGDSINRNQWESMLCLLRGAITDPARVYETHGRRITKGKGNYSFKFVDYKCTVEYYVTHFLVHESKARVGQKRVQTLRIDSIDRGSSRWKGADVLVFNTAHWWSHYKTKAGGGQWNSGGHCKEATQPLNNISGTDYPEKNVIAEEVIKQMKTPVTLLNVTSLSEYRIDGHPSVYGRKPRKGTSSSIQDCSHWCLPGVPDTWNELLYYYLQSKEKHSST
ncbi:PREDICTED: protein trichome birefringence-like 6 isoform X2 [Nelumbo nucifera]|uniref:Protein trichome birefringence-like 6 isoform X2 n=1 Tax=Nelumbo nucifera TaxID=4432 RepID=A0A1U8AKZ2_NELNU|nr:PREDICTED: protein trichome birefringence-like 6 isoform X2 [Nelumbo nucifera]